MGGLKGYAPIPKPQKIETKNQVLHAKYQLILMKIMIYSMKNFNIHPVSWENKKGDIS